MNPVKKRGRPPGSKKQPELSVVPEQVDNVKPMKWGREEVEAYLMDKYGTTDPDFRRNVKPPVMQRVQSQ